jgi:biotin carboxylase
VHIAFVDSNNAGLEAIKCAAEDGHRVTFLQAAKPSFYPFSAANLRLIGHASQVVGDVATTDAASVTAALARCHAAHPIDFATSQFELSVEPVAHACKALGLPGTNPDGVLVARRKDVLRAALRDAGIATAAFAVARDAGEALTAAAGIGYPVVIKPPSGLDSRLVFIARDPDEVRAGCARALSGLAALPAAWHGQLTRGFLVEEHLSGPLVSVEIGMSGGRGHVFCISGRTRSRDDEVIETGVHIPAELPADRATACASYAAAVCRAIGLDRGIFHMEMIVTTRGPVLVEANPRIMGGVLPTVYSHATGESIYRAFLQVISGAESLPSPAFRGCVAGRRLFARTPGVMPGDWDTGDWLGEHQSSVIRVDSPEDLGICPGDQVQRGQVIARVILRADGYAETARAARDIIGRAEKALGLDLMRGEYDEDLC